MVEHRCPLVIQTRDSLDFTSEEERELQSKRRCRRRRARSSDFDLQQSFEVLSQQLVSHIHRTLFSLRSQQQNSAGTSIANNLPSCSKNCCIEMLTNNFANELRLPEIQKNVDDITDLSVNIKDPLILTAIGRKSYPKS